MDYLNQLQDWIINNAMPMIAFAIAIVIFYVIKAILIHRLEKISQRTKNDFDDLVVDILKTIRLSFAVVISLMIALAVAGYDFIHSPWTVIIFTFVVTYQVARAVGVIFHFVVAKANGGKTEPANVSGLKTIINIAVWVSGLLFVLTSLGFNVNSIIAGLGIGGIAVALALQNILSDVFSSFSIYFDKPFEVGDYIIVGDKEGTVERIGMKTTRIRSMRGEELIMSNRDLTNAVVQNFGTLEKRRVVDVIGFGYCTSKEQLEKMPVDLEKIINAIDGIDFERIYFKDFGDSALEHELSYYIDNEKFDHFSTAIHQVNLKLKEYFEKEKLNIAYPTRTVIVQK